MYLFYINIFIYFKYYTTWNQFFIKIHVKICYIQIWFKREASLLLFSNKNHDLQKKNFIETNMKKLLNYMLYTQDITYNLSRWNNRGNDIYKKDQQKLKILKK